MTTKKSNVKVGVFLSAILMMGGIGVSSALAGLSEWYGMNMTDTVFGIVSTCCIAVCVVTLVSGFLMNKVPKKILLILGILLFIIGGIIPAFTGKEFGAVMAMRIVFGAGTGLVQACCPAILAENYEGAECAKAMGWNNSFQMLGCIAMQLIGGFLGSMIPITTVYFVHLFGIISLIFAIIFVPYKKPMAAESGEKPKITITGGLIFAGIMFFIFMVAGQIFSNNASGIITNLGIGSSSEAGLTIAFFAAGGFIMGFLFDKIFGKCKGYTMSLGFAILAISYLIMAYGMNMPMQFVGAFVCGLAFSICMPLFFALAAGSVDAATSGFAISFITCLQNVGMVICPYVVAAAAPAVAEGFGVITDQGALIFGAILIALFAVIFLIRAIALRKKA